MRVRLLLRRVYEPRDCEIPSWSCLETTRMRIPTGNQLRCKTCWRVWATDGNSTPNELNPSPVVFQGSFNNEANQGRPGWSCNSKCRCTATHQKHVLQERPQNLVVSDVLWHWHPRCLTWTVHMNHRTWGLCHLLLETTVRMRTIKLLNRTPRQCERQYGKIPR